MVRISLYRIKPILILVQAVAIASERRTLLLPYLRSSAFSVFFRIPRACSHFTRTNVRRPLFFFEVIHNGVGFRVPRTLAASRDHLRQQITGRIHRAGNYRPGLVPNLMLNDR
jgi:hypothetical protein